MTLDQAIDYLETTDAIPVRDMSRAMLRLLRSASRMTYRVYAGMAGYYDPEYDGPRADPWRVRFPGARNIIPQSPALRQRYSDRIPDPMRNIITN